MAIKQVHPAATDYGGQVIEAQYLADARPCCGDSGGPLFLDGKLAGVAYYRTRQMRFSQTSRKLHHTQPG